MTTKKSGYNDFFPFGFSDSLIALFHSLSAGFIKKCILFVRVLSGSTFSSCGIYQELDSSCAGFIKKCILFVRVLSGSTFSSCGIYQELDSSCAGFIKKCILLVRVLSRSACSNRRFYQEIHSPSASFIRKCLLCMLSLQGFCNFLLRYLLILCFRSVYGNFDFRAIL